MVGSNIVLEQRVEKLEVDFADHLRAQDLADEGKQIMLRILVKLDKNVESLMAFREESRQQFVFQNARINKLEQKFNQRMDALEQSTCQRIDELEQKTTEHFTLLEGRFDSLEGRFESLEGRFDSLEGRFDSLEGRFDSLEGRFESLEGRFGSLEKNTSEGFARIERLLTQ